MITTTARMLKPGAALARMREATPLVHCITNYVAMTPAANTLLAAGASPAMIHAPEEAGDFAPLAAALTVNIGTLSEPWLEGMRRATSAALGAGLPWVLDPVAHFASPWRSRAAAELVAGRPAVIRGNASEIIVLAGGQAAGKGADAGDSVAAAVDAAVRLALGAPAVVAVTGAVDFVTDGRQGWRVAGGSPLMTQVTAMGCSLTTLIGGFVAVGEDHQAATTAALAMFGAAGAVAARSAPGPGSFAAAMLDALHALTPEALDAADLARAA